MAGNRCLERDTEEYVVLPDGAPKHSSYVIEAAVVATDNPTSFVVVSKPLSKRSFSTHHLLALHPLAQAC